MSLYTKYRSQTFDDLVEQDSVKQILKNQVIKINSWESKLSNYIFFWPRWTGKTSIARIFAKAINCTNNKDGNPCNVCDACLSITNNRTLDVIEIDAASHTGVDNIRDEIISKAIYPPSSLRKKIYIIDEAHMLSKSAFNALLKIIEEPPEYLVFILATTDPQKILDTVKSRCQMFGFKNITMNGIISRLKYVSGLENIKYDEQWLNLIAKIANGGMRDALKYLDQVSGIGDATADIVTQTLGIAGDGMIVDFIDVFMSDNIANIYTWIDNLSNTWLDLANFVKDLGQYIDRNLTSSNMSTYMYIIQVVKWYFENIRNYPFPNTVLKYQIALVKWVSDNIYQKNSLTTISGEPKTNNQIKIDIPISKNELETGWAIENQKKSNQDTELIAGNTVHQSEISSESQKISSIIKDSSDTDLWAIKQYIVDNSPNSIKWIWAKSCEVSSIDWNILKVTVINAWSVVILNAKKPDTEKILAELMDRNLVISYEVINSEDLLQNLIGSDDNLFW